MAKSAIPDFESEGLPVADALDELEMENFRLWDAIEEKDLEREKLDIKPIYSLMYGRWQVGKG